MSGTIGSVPWVVGPEIERRDGPTRTARGRGLEANRATVAPAAGSPRALWSLEELLRSLCVLEERWHLEKALGVRPDPLRCGRRARVGGKCGLQRDVARRSGEGGSQTTINEVINLRPAPVSGTSARLRSDIVTSKEKRRAVWRKP